MHPSARIAKYFKAPIDNVVIMCRGDIWNCSTSAIFSLFAKNTTSAKRPRNVGAQPSLTKAIQRLEESVGGLLFVRRPNAQPTALALALKPHFEQMIFSAQQVRQKANHILRITPVATMSANGTKRTSAMV